MFAINYFAVIAAAVSSFLLGGLWYSKLLFEDTWLRESGADMQEGHTPTVFALSLVFALIAATVFAVWLGPNPPLDEALTAGLLAGAGLVAPCFGINYLFARRSLILWLVDGGYHTLQFLLFGLVLGLWH